MKSSIVQRPSVKDSDLHSCTNEENSKEQYDVALQLIERSLKEKNYDTLIESLDYCLSNSCCFEQQSSMELLQRVWKSTLTVMKQEASTEVVAKLCQLLDLIASKCAQDPESLKQQANCALDNTTNTCDSDAIVQTLNGQKVKDLELTDANLSYIQTITKLSQSIQSRSSNDREAQDRLGQMGCIEFVAKVMAQWVSEAQNGRLALYETNQNNKQNTKKQTLQGQQALNIAQSKLKGGIIQQDIQFFNSSKHGSKTAKEQNSETKDIKLVEISHTNSLKAGLQDSFSALCHMCLSNQKNTAKLIDSGGAKIITEGLALLRQDSTILQQACTLLGNICSMQGTNVQITSLCLSTFMQIAQNLPSDCTVDVLRTALWGIATLASACAAYLHIQMNGQPTDNDNSSTKTSDEQRRSKKGRSAQRATNQVDIINQEVFKLTTLRLMQKQLSSALQQGKRADRCTQKHCLEYWDACSYMYQQYQQKQGAASTKASKNNNSHTDTYTSIFNSVAMEIVTFVQLGDQLDVKIKALAIRSLRFLYERLNYMLKRTDKYKIQEVMESIFCIIAVPCAEPFPVHCPDHFSPQGHTCYTRSEAVQHTVCVSATTTWQFSHGPPQCNCRLAADELMLQVYGLNVVRRIFSIADETLGRTLIKLHHDAIHSCLDNIVWQYEKCRRGDTEHQGKGPYLQITPCWAAANCYLVHQNLQVADILNAVRCAAQMLNVAGRIPTNAADDDGLTILHKLALSGLHEAMAIFLSEASGQVNFLARSKCGHSPLQVALNCNNDECAALLDAPTDKASQLAQKALLMELEGGSKGGKKGGGKAAVVGVKKGAGGSGSKEVETNVVGKGKSSNTSAPTIKSKAKKKKKSIGNESDKKDPSQQQEASSPSSPSTIPKLSQEEQQQRLQSEAAQRKQEMEREYEAALELRRQQLQQEELEAEMARVKQACEASMVGSGAPVGNTVGAGVAPAVVPSSGGGEWEEIPEEILQESIREGEKAREIAQQERFRLELEGHADEGVDASGGHSDTQARVRERDEDDEAWQEVGGGGHGSATSYTTGSNAWNVSRRKGSSNMGAGANTATAAALPAASRGTNASPQTQTRQINHIPQHTPTHDDVLLEPRTPCPVVNRHKPDVGSGAGYSYSSGSCPGVSGADASPPSIGGVNIECTTPTHPPADDPANISVTATRHLWLGNLLTKLHASHLLALFTAYGAVESVKVHPGYRYAFVNYHRAADAARAMAALENTDVDELTGGRPLVIKFREDKRPLGRMNDVGEGDDGDWEGGKGSSCSVLVSEVGANVSVPDIRGKLSEFGEIVGLNCVKTKSGTVVGCTYSTSDSAMRAVECFHNKLVTQLNEFQTLKVVHVQSISPANTQAAETAVYGSYSELSPTDTEVHTHTLSSLQPPDMSGTPIGGANSSSTTVISSGPFAASRHLWLGNIGSGRGCKAALEAAFGKYGTVESVRVFSNKGYAFVNFKSVDAAIAAKEALSGKNLAASTGGRALIIKYQRDESGGSIKGDDLGPLAGSKGVGGSMPVQAGWVGGGKAVAGKGIQPPPVGGAWGTGGLPGLSGANSLPSSQDGNNAAKQDMVSQWGGWGASKPFAGDSQVGESATYADDTTTSIDAPQSMVPPTCAPSGMDAILSQPLEQPPAVGSMSHGHTTTSDPYGVSQPPPAHDEPHTNFHPLLGMLDAQSNDTRGAVSTSMFTPPPQQRQIEQKGLLWGQEQTAQDTPVEFGQNELEGWERGMRSSNAPLQHMSSFQLGEVTGSAVLGDSESGQAQHLGAPGLGGLHPYEQLGKKMRGLGIGADKGATGTSSGLFSQPYQGASMGQQLGGASRDVWGSAGLSNGLQECLPASDADTYSHGFSQNLHSPYAAVGAFNHTDAAYNGFPQTNNLHTYAGQQHKTSSALQTDRLAIDDDLAARHNYGESGLVEPDPLSEQYTSPLSSYGTNGLLTSFPGQPSTSNAQSVFPGKFSAAFSANGGQWAQSGPMATGYARGSDTGSAGTLGLQDTGSVLGLSDNRAGQWGDLHLQSTDQAARLRAVVENVFQDVSQDCGGVQWSSEGGLDGSQPGFNADINAGKF